MYTSHNVAQLIKSAVDSLRRDVLPHTSDPQAAMTAEMCLVVLDWAQRLVSTEQPVYAQETREMHELFAALERLLANDASSEAERIRERARTLHTSAPLAAQPTYESLLGAHRALSEALIPTLADLHALDARDHAGTYEALAIVRSHLASRAQRDLSVYLGAPTGDAMIGRT